MSGRHEKLQASSMDKVPPDNTLCIHFRTRDWRGTPIERLKVEALLVLDPDSALDRRLPEVRRGRDDVWRIWSRTVDIRVSQGIAQEADVQGSKVFAELQTPSDPR